MPDFRLHPSTRTPGGGRDFRLYPGWTGAVAGLLVAGTAVAPSGIAGGIIAVGSEISVGGMAVAASGIVLGAVELHRMIIATARAPWTGLVTASKHCIAPWPSLRPLPLVQRARSAALASLPLMLRSLWPGLPSLQLVKRALWSGLQPTPSLLHRAIWPGLPSLQDVKRARWGVVFTTPSSRVLAKWNDLWTPTQMLRANWNPVLSAPSAPVTAKWNDLLTPWVRYRIRWGRLITPPWVWPRPDYYVHPKPDFPVPVADVFRLYLRNNPRLYDFRLHLGGPFLVSTQRTLLMTPTCILYRLSDNLPLVGESLNLRADRDSYGWAVTLTTPDVATVEALFTADPPESFAAVVNGHLWHLQPQSWRQTVAFGSLSYTITANSRTALLDAPFAEASTGTVTASLTARQIAEAALTATGFSLQWDVPVDPALPAGRVTWRDATPKMRVRAIAEALGATLQSVMATDTLIVTPRRILAPWELAGQVPEVVLNGALITGAELGMADPMVEDCVYVSGTETGYLVKVTRAGMAGQVPAPTVADPYLTEVLACRERGRQVLAALANRKSLSVATILNTAGSPPGVLKPGTLVELVVGTAHWLDEVMSCSIEVKFGQVTQSMGFGEGAGNAYKRLQQLLPTDPLLVGTVIAVWADGTSTIELPGGGEWRVKGDSIAIGARVYVQGGMIQGEAPALAGASVEV